MTASAGGSVASGSRGAGGTPAGPPPLSPPAPGRPRGGAAARARGERKEGAPPPAEPLQGAAQDDRGRDAVDVVVAVDRDALAPLDRREQAIDRGPHVGEQERVVELIERGVQEAARGVGVG